MNPIPDKDEERFAMAIKDNIVASLEKLPEVSVIPVGSIEKGTWLSGSYDIDIFVVCEDPEKMFEKYRKILEIDDERIHSGDLLIRRMMIDGIQVDVVFVVPNFDRVQTLEHAYFYRDNLTPKQKERVRMWKAYMKTLGLYGAEQGGITGVAIEELVRLHDMDSTIVHILTNDELAFLQDPRISKERDLLASITPLRHKQIQKYLPNTQNLLQRMMWLYHPFNEGAFYERYRDCPKLMFWRYADVAADFSKSVRMVNRSINQLKKEYPEVGVDFDVFIGETLIHIAYNPIPDEVSWFRIHECKSTNPEHEKAFIAKHGSAARSEFTGYLHATIERECDTYKVYGEKIRENMKLEGFAYAEE